MNKSMWKTLGMFVSLNIESITQFFFSLVNLLSVHCLILDIHVMLLTPHSCHVIDTCQNNVSAD